MNDDTKTCPDLYTWRSSRACHLDRPRKSLDLPGGVLIAGLLSSCASTPPPLDQHGLWNVPGYGTILDIAPDGVSLIERTSISCTQADEDDNLESLFEEELAIALDGTDRLRINVATAQTGYVLERLADDQLDALCPEIITEELADPERSFEIFWATFDQHYAFFDRRGVDWDETYERYRHQVDQATTADRLLDILTAMVAPLRDGHVQISPDGEEAVDIFKPDLVQSLIDECATHEAPCEDPDAYLEEQADRFLSTLKETYLDGDVETALDGQLFWGQLSSDVGYLFFGAAGDYSDDGSSTDDFARLQPVLDRVFTDLAPFPNLIIDLRANGGGDDYVGLSLANRLADERRQVFEKSAFENGVLTPPQRAFIEPVDRPSYDGDVIALTSPLTASAAEILTLALRELPQVTLLGTSTMGAFSDIQERTLPNGLVFGLSNEIYNAADGEIFEGRGIPPDVEHPFVPLSDRRQGIDGMIDKALSIIAEADSKSR